MKCPISILIFLLLALCLNTHAQSDYSPCYKENIAAGHAAFVQHNYKVAISYYVKAKHCKGRNLEETKKQKDYAKFYIRTNRTFRQLSRSHKRDKPVLKRGLIPSEFLEDGTDEECEDDED
jgi:hypothetical protein